MPRIAPRTTFEIDESFVTLYGFQVIHRLTLSPPSSMCAPLVQVDINSSDNFAVPQMTQPCRVRFFLWQERLYVN